MSDPPNYWLVASSHVFIFPIVHSYNAEIYSTTCAYTFLYLTSIYYHSTYSEFGFYIDQFAIGVSIMRSIVDGFLSYPFGILGTIAANIYNYYIFVHTKQCNNPDIRIATAAHASMHIFAAIAVSLQMMLIAQQKNSLILDVDLPG